MTSTVLQSGFFGTNVWDQSRQSLLLHIKFSLSFLYKVVLVSPQNDLKIEEKTLLEEMAQTLLEYSTDKGSSC